MIAAFLLGFVSGLVVTAIAVLVLIRSGRIEP